MGATTLTTAQMPKHTHVLMSPTGDKNYNGGYNCNTWWGNTNDRSSTTTSAGSSSEHTHPLTGSKSTSASSFPPYYTLAYIMRCA